MLSEEHSLLSTLARALVETLSAASQPPLPLTTRARFIATQQERFTRMRQGRVADESDEEIECSDGRIDEELEATADAGQVTVSSPELRSALSCGHPILQHRRYSPMIADLKCVLNVPGVARRFCVDPPHDVEVDLELDRRLRRRRQRDCFGLWTQALSSIQGMDPLTRRVAGAHVE